MLTNSLKSRSVSAALQHTVAVRVFVFRVVYSLLSPLSGCCYYRCIVFLPSSVFPVAAGSLCLCGCASCPARRVRPAPCHWLLVVCAHWS